MAAQWASAGIVVTSGSFSQDATNVLERFGAAARGDRIYCAGQVLG
jgi:hypothetical protein